MDDYSTISIVLTGLSVSLAAIYYMSVLNETKNNQKIRTYTEFIGLSFTKDFANAWIDVIYYQHFNSFEDWWNQYGPETNRDQWLSLVMICEFMQSVALMMVQKIITPKLLYAHWGEATVRFWDKYGGIAKELRVRFSHPTFWLINDYLYEEMKKYGDNLP